MCIIAVKPIGVKLPEENILRNMWDINSEGAGFMYPDGKGHVLIRKGFMKWKSFKRNLDSLAKQIDMTNTPLIMHFRITTHGGTRPENTHPFPVTDHIETLKKTSVRTTLGVAHNGIIHSVDPRTGLSDTMEYIASQLAPLRRALPNFLENKDATLMVKNAIGSYSKLAFLTGAGEIFTIGDFITEDGMLYSNSSFRGYYTNARSVKWSKYPASWYEDETAYDYGYWHDNYWGSAAENASDVAAGKVRATAETWDENVDERQLMVLSDEEYIRTLEGEMFSGEGYFMDEDQHVYEYDEDIGYAVEIPGVYAYDATTSAPVRFDEEKACDFPYLTTKKAKSVLPA